MASHPFGLAKCWRAAAIAVPATLCMLLAQSAEAKDVLTTFDADTVTGLNAAQEVTGTAGNAGFVRTVDGTITTFAIPDAVETHSTGINDAGAVAGWYRDSSFALHSFVRATDGTLTIFDPCCAASINKRGEITGSAGSDSFLRKPNGKIWSINVPGAEFTTARDISQAGVITGYFADRNPDYHEHGFIRAADGSITTFDVPGADIARGYSINLSGIVTGISGSTSSGFNGFVRAADGTITAITQSDGCTGTLPRSINRDGSIAGECYWYHGTRGMLRLPDGTVQGFRILHSSATHPCCINRAGVIAGIYRDESAGRDRGFLLLIP